MVELAMMMSSGWPAVTVRHEGGLHRQDLIELLLPDAGAAVHEAIVVSQSDRTRENGERLFLHGCCIAVFPIREGYDVHCAISFNSTKQRESLLPSFTRPSRSKKMDEVSKSTLGEGGYVMESYYDDHTPDVVMGNNYDSDSSPWRQSNGDAYYGQDDPPEQQQQQQQMQQNYDETSNGRSP